MDARYLFRNPDKQSEMAFVFLPGRLDEPDDFTSNGFVEDLWKKGIDADVVIADAHLGYYYERIFDERMMEDIIQPLRKRGYRQILAVGVSLGGFGAVMMEKDHPGTWDGIILIAPFVGDQNAILRQVRESNGLDSVDFPRELTDDDYTAQFWKWMREYKRDPEFPIYLGLGTDDRMYNDQILLAQAIGPDRIIRTRGGHNWVVWKELWQKLLIMLDQEQREG